MKDCPRCGNPIADNETNCPYCASRALAAEHAAPPGPPPTMSMPEGYGQAGPPVAYNPPPAPPPGFGPPPVPIYAPGGPPKTSTMAIIALILSFIPFLCISLVGSVLGIVALVQISNRPHELKGRGFAIAAIIIGVAWMVIGILAAIAIPSFLKFQAKAKQSEAKVNLSAIYVKEVEYLGKYQTYADNFEALGWTPEGNNRYAYFLPGGSIQPATGISLELPPDTEPIANSDELKIIAVGNIDNDNALDVWVIDQSKALTNVVDDVMVYESSSSPSSSIDDD